MNFIDLCLNGDILADEISDYIEQWHTDDTAHDELHEHLGMTWDEYSIWATRPSILAFILTARQHSIPLDEVLGQERLALAARAETVEDATRMEAWLKLIGKIH